MPNDTNSLKIGTRGSDLALYQANFVKDLIAERLQRECELVILKTQGDKDQTRPVQDLGGVGVFVKELERALLASEVDLAVHSLKDLPTDLPEGLVVAAYPIRVSPHEALVCNPSAIDQSQGVIPLKQGARVGTSSLRRKAQLLELRPDLEIVGIRGNVPRRVGLAKDEVDAVMLAAAGIDRLELDLGELVRVDLPAEEFLPAPGQGALALEVRTNDTELLEQLAQLDDAEARRTTETERALLHDIGAGCSVPLGAYAVVDGDELLLRAAFETGQTADELPILRRATAREASPEAAASLALRILAPPAADPHTPDLFGKQIIVARDADRAAELVRALEAAGASVKVHPPTRREALEADAAAALEQLPDSGWLLFASVNAVRELERAAGNLVEGGRRIGAVGPGTARALGRAGLPVDLLADTATGAGLAESFLSAVGEERPDVLIPAARGGRTELSDALRAAGCNVTVLELYESVAADPVPPKDLLESQALILASPSGARAALAAGAPGGLRIVAYGPTTASATEEFGARVAAVADAPTVAGVLAALAGALEDL